MPVIDFWYKSEVSVTEPISTRGNSVGHQDERFVLRIRGGAFTLGLVERLRPKLECLPKPRTRFGGLAAAIPCQRVGLQHRHRLESWW